MATSTETIKWWRVSSLAFLAIATVGISLTAAFLSASVHRRKSRRLATRVRELEASLEASQEKAASERRGRVRVQQALRKALTQQGSDDGSKAYSSSTYPMAPIGIVQSCFSARNGTPRQPLLVPLSRASLVFDLIRVPPEALEGLADYSHCWILYVFHLNTDIEKLWNQPSRSKFKAKVRVPRLGGGKMGVLATRSPHRPSPIGLTVAKVEALDGHAILLSGVDLVDGTPVLDIKPYLPYSDSIQGAAVPKWVKAENALSVASVSFSTDFLTSLSSCWAIAEKQSLYASADEFQRLIKEVLSWDIRSLSQKDRPHHVALENKSNGVIEPLENDGGDDLHETSDGNSTSLSSADVTYHLILEGIDISYRIDGNSDIIVEKANTIPGVRNSNKNRYNYLMWREKLEQQKSRVCAT